MKKRKSLVVAFAFSIIYFLLATSCSNAFASAIDNKASLPDWAINYITWALGPNASSTKIAEVEGHWLNQMLLKQERIASTNGAVLRAAPESLTDSWSYMSQWLRDEPLYGGQIIGGPWLVGIPNGWFARWYTPNINQGATTIGQMSNAYSTGDVYVRACLGPTGAGQNGNYLIVYGSNDPDASLEEWMENVIGWAQIGYPYTWPWSGINYFIGFTHNTYRYVAVGVTTFTGGIDTYNDVMGDSIYFDML